MDSEVVSSGARSVNGPAYKNIIYDSRIIESFDEMIGAMRHFWQQDNAPAHSPSRE
jgi:hypothetical protein